MGERLRLSTSIAATAGDYRIDALPAPVPEHVDRWVGQFDTDVQLPILREFDHVLKKTYLSRDRIEKFLSSLVRNEKIAGSDPCGFWKKADFLRIQMNGNSQEEMLALFDSVLYAQCGFITRKCDAGDNNLIYIDDAMFSGSRIGNDLARWIADDAPQTAIVHVIVFAIHTSGEWLVGNRLRDAIATSGKKIEIRYWRAATIENRMTYRRNADVLWPSELPDDPLVEAYTKKACRYPFEARAIGGNAGPFSSEEGRALLEREFLLAGLRIRALCTAPKDIMRPLGFSPFAIGFGSLIVTYRNCPNNCPLALWWGDPHAGARSPLSKWYPLFARKTYRPTVLYDRDGLDTDAESSASDFGFDDE